MGMARSTNLTGFWAGKESVYGVKAPPTLHLRETGGSATLSQEFVETKARLGSRLPAGKIRVGEQGQASLPFEADVNSAQLIFAAFTGNESVSGTGPYTHTFTPLNSALLPSFTIHELKAGYLRYAYTGAVLNSVSMEINPQGIVTMGTDWVFKTEVEEFRGITGASFSPADDEVTLPAHGFVDGTPVKFFRDSSTSQLPTPLTFDTVYFVRDATTNTFKLAATSGGAAIDLGGTPSGAFVIVPQVTVVANTALPHTYNDAWIELDNAQFNEVRKVSINMSNNLKTDDFRINLQGQLYSVSADKLTLTGSVAMVFNEDSRAHYAKVKTQASTSIRLWVQSGVNKIEVMLPEVRYSDVSWEEGDLLLNLNFELVNQWPTFTVVNGVPTTI